jgi:PadR family transcriptional regulator, regulatory protein AphA
MSTANQTGSRTRFLILGLLSEGPMSGYDLVKITRLRFRFFWSESYGQVYPELRRLAEEGLVAQGAERGPRGKSTWTVTAKGRAALRAWLEAPECSDQARLESVLKAYFSFAAPGSLESILELFGTRLSEDIAALEGMGRELRAIPDPHKNHQYPLMTIELGLAIYSACRDWAARWAGKGL